MISNFKRKPAEPSDLEKQLARLFAKLNDIDEMDSEEYDRVSDQIKKLYPLKETDSKTGVSSDVLVSAASNLVGIMMIISYEHVHVLNSKALAFIGKSLKR
ncbi:hypothetical protein SEA_KARDASHIAN_29 [Streptomyces phage Kardashian]|nr:hypothetical protein SEA_KARDASHIAN_29 [Streptomyces phage Kardashian]